ncbi:uncharacterized protein METZ01_LOCUS172639 [marine metagenome]|uniref:DUF4314 domain-containing protein n=1 Tax=marine metagenome TaxID=408172 RepID=A0A382C124_9ZZZZ
MNVTIEKGDRIRLVYTADPYTDLVRGCEGVVRRIDAVGTVHVKWDSGSRLGLVPGLDEFVILR